jgi:hypothetical protein
MARITGKSGIVEVGSNDVLQVTEFSLEISNEFADISVLNDQWADQLPLKSSWTATVSVNMDTADTTGQESLETAATNRSTVSVVLKPEGDSGGDKKYTGTAYIESLSMTIPEDVATREISLTGKGELTVGTV